MTLLFKLRLNALGSENAVKGLFVDIKVRDLKH